MATVSPYITGNVQLEGLQETVYFSSNYDAGYYYTFWWKQIPLGHLFIERNERIDHHVFQQRIWEAIEPGVKFYISKHGGSISSYAQTFIGEDYAGFSSLMDTLLAIYNAEELPGKLNVSVIICTCNRSNDLHRCLTSLLNQKYLPAEIIVIDNAPSDSTTLNVVAQFKEVIYYKEERKGLSRARNAGLRLATSPIIAFADDDVLLHPLWLYRVWETFLSPGVTSMTGLVIASSLETESQQIFERFWSFNRGYKDKIFNHEFIDRNLKIGPPVWEIGAGANMAFRKSIFDTIGYFDERLGAGAAGCSEDSELWFRILDHGFDIHYNPRAVMYHEHRKELSALRKQIYSYVRGHAAAALIQQKQNEETGYWRRVYFAFPRNYLRRLVYGFPTYPLQYRTLFSEIRGWVSGINCFQKIRTKPPQMNF